MEKFETAFDLLEELDFVKDKMAFMGDIAGLFASNMNPDFGLSDAARIGLYMINCEIQTQCEDIRKALDKDFIITKKLPEMPAGKAKESKLDNFCAAVEKEISRPCKKCAAVN